MKTSNNIEDEDHLDDLKLPYLENLLTPDEMAKVDKHLKSCTKCSLELAEFRKWASTIQSNQEIFCPEPWDLLDLARGAAAPDPSLQAHVDRCPKCREELEALNPSHRDELSPELWAKMTGPVAKPPVAGPMELTRRLLEDLSERISSWFRMPVMALGTVAAVVLLLVVVLYPLKEPAAVVGLSSVSWSQGLLERNIMGGGGAMTSPGEGLAQKPRLTVIIFLKGFKEPVTQPRIDSFYEALEPTPEMLRVYSALTPAEVSDAVAEKKIDTSSRIEILKGLRKTLSVSRAVLVTLSQKNGRFDIDGEFDDTETGRSLRRLVLRGIAAGEIDSKLRESLLVLANAT